MKISALILTKNEEEMIEDCLSQLDFVNEIIVLDQFSSDKTVDVAQKYTNKILKTKNIDFDKNRMLLASEARAEWLLYIDSDERISADLKSEILKAVEKNKISAYFIPRKNYVLGKWLKHGGFWPDYVPKLFNKEKLRGWTGKVHESPVFSGESSKLVNPLEHLSARSLNKMLEKTIKWAKIEAELARKSNHPKVNIARVIKSFINEFISRYVLKLGLLDGVQGLIQALYQAYHRSIMLVYLWEKQSNIEEEFKTIKNV